MYFKSSFLYIFVPIILFVLNISKQGFSRQKCLKTNVIYVIQSERFDFKSIQINFKTRQIVPSSTLSLYYEIEFRRTSIYHLVPNNDPIVFNGFITTPNLTKFQSYKLQYLGDLMLSCRTSVSKIVHSTQTSLIYPFATLSLF